MKKLILLQLIVNFTILQFAYSQGGSWAWLGGDTLNSIQSPDGIYGTQGVPSPNNWPPDVYGSAYWTGNDGNFYLFGGGRDSIWPYQIQHNDMWQYDPTTGNWTWINGPGIINSLGSFGTQGVASPTNHPPAMKYPITWTTPGTLWLYGGDGSRAGAYASNLTCDDLWKYELATGYWTWMKGSAGASSTPNYGTLGVAAMSNTPGARWSAASCVDANGNLLMYGGDNSSPQVLEDLWMYNPSTNMWTWINGSTTSTLNPVWGTLNIANASNNPSQRAYSIGWNDSQGNLLMFGGFGRSPVYNDGFNDLWKYDLSNSFWTWINGENISGAHGSYPSYCDAGEPAGRIFHPAFTSDNLGNAWMFGGAAPWWTLQHLQNDLWFYKENSNEWIRIAGDTANFTLLTYYNIYGQQGVPALANVPQSRVAAAMWYDGTSSLFMYGGYGYSTRMNQLWRFDIDSNCIATTGIVNDEKEGSDFSVFPNPLSSTTTLEFNLSETINVSIYITDVMGRIVKTISTKNLQQGKNKIEINLSELNNGIYFCKINSTENNQTIKLIKN